METQYGSYFVAHRSLDIYVRVSKAVKPPLAASQFIEQYD
jgi:hypothetical protein